MGFLFLIIIAVICYFLYRFYKQLSVPRVGSLTLVTGGVKCGKSTFALGLALKNYERIHRQWKFDNFICHIFKRDPIEEPLFYSNIPLSIPYVPLTEDLLLRRKRFRFGSIIFIDEASLVANSMKFANKNINERLEYFNKLIGHELHGVGGIIYDTQSIHDLHFSIKRCLSSYFYVHHLDNTFFGLIANVREEIFSEDGTRVNNYSDSVSNNLLKVLIPRKTWSLFDSCTYSTFTDFLPCEDNVISTDDLKSYDIVSFHDTSILKKLYDGDK